MTFRRVGKSGTLSLNEKMAMLERAGRSLVKIGFGESPFSPPARVQAALRCAAPRAEYTAVAGLPELRERVAAFHSEIDGHPIEMEQALIAPGTKPLLYSVMQAFENAEVYLPAPSWLSYGPHARLAGHEVIRVPTTWEGRWRVTAAELDDIIARRGRGSRCKLMVLNYPGNPEGLTYSRAELSALAGTLRKHGVWVISDEIYALLDHRGRHVSLASLYPERTMISTGLSKWCGAGGWRLGCLIIPAGGPRALRDALLGLGSEIYSCAPAPIQIAAMAAYTLDGELANFLAGQRTVLSTIGMAIHAALVKAGLRVHPPQGGIYMLVDFRPFRESLERRGIATDAALCERLLEATGVALLPGSVFGLEARDLTARLAYVDFDGDAALREASRADGDITRFAAKMERGIARMGEWLLAEEQQVEAENQ